MMWKVGNRKVKGFTLLELLVVMALISVLSFSVVYALGNPRDSLIQSQRYVEKLLKTARRMAVLKHQECRLLVLNDSNSEDNGRLLTTAVKDQSGEWVSKSAFVSIPKGSQVSFSGFGTLSLSNVTSVPVNSWHFISFSSTGLCDSSVYLSLIADDSVKMTFTISSGGKITIEK